MSDMRPTTTEDAGPGGTFFPAEPDSFDLPPPHRESTPQIEAIRKLFDSARATETFSPDGVERLRLRTESLAGIGYDVVQPLGRGAMGEVYLARHLKLNRLVALKFIRSEFHDSDTDFSLRLLEEARAVARVPNPNVVQVFDVGEVAGQPFLTLEYVAGGTLDEKLAAGPIPPRAAAELVREITQGVSHAHGQGMIHRDLKPGNILLGLDGTPKVSDFGLARVFDGLADETGVPTCESSSGSTAVPSATRGGLAAGTPSYMAPEQV